VQDAASDFTGDAVGQAQQKTRAIVALAQGKVLIIDEAFTLLIWVLDSFVFPRVGAGHAVDGV